MQTFENLLLQNHLTKFLDIRPGKDFGSGQMIFENRSDGPVDVFFSPTT